MSEMRARASRRAFCFGSCTMNGFTGRSGPVLRLPGVLAPAAAGGAGAGAGRAGDGADATRVAADAVAPAPSGLTAKTLLQTLQRARRPPAGTFAGSTRYTVSHDGQVTFTPYASWSPLSSSPCSRSWRRSTTKTDPACVFA